MAIQGGGGRFSALLLEGLDHYRKGRMLDAVKAWEEAYLLEPTNLRAREFLRSALERIHAVMSPAKATSDAAPPHPWLPAQPATAAQAIPSSAPRQPAPAPAQASPGKPRPAAAAPAKPPATPRNAWDEGPSLAIPPPET